MTRSSACGQGRPMCSPRAGSPALSDGAHPLGPRRIVRPRADRDLDRLRRRRSWPRSCRCGPRAGRRRGRRRSRAGRPACPSGRPCGLVIDRRRRDAARLDLDVVALGKDDADRASRRVIGGERPDREGHQRIADAQVTGRRPTRILEVEGQAVLGGLAAVQPLGEVEPEERVGLGPLAGTDGRRAVALPAQPEPGRPGQDRQERLVEVVALGPRVLEVVAQGQVDRDPDALLIGWHVVAGDGRDRQVGARRPDLDRSRRAGRRQ